MSKDTGSFSALFRRSRPRSHRRGIRNSECSSVSARLSWPFGHVVHRLRGRNTLREKETVVATNKAKPRAKMEYDNNSKIRNIKACAYRLVAETKLPELATKQGPIDSQ